MSRLKNNPYRDVSPGVLFRALSDSTRSGDTPEPGRDNTLDKSIQYAAEEEKHFGVDVAKSARALKAWCQELEAWQPTQNRNVGVEIDKLREPFSSTGSAEENNDEPTAREGGRWKWLDTPEELASYYQQRVDEIKKELGGLDIEKQKAAVLDTHQRYQRLSGTGAEIGSYNTQLTGLSALITAVILNSLPYHGQLLTLMDVWTTRLLVLSYVPGFLVRLQDMTEALLAAWRRIQSHDEAGGPPNDLQEYGIGNAIWNREMFGQLQQDLTQQLATLGQQLDAMLDALESREDTLPDQWIDDVDGLEEGFASWGVSAEASVRQVEARLRKLAAEQYAHQELEKEQRHAMEQVLDPSDRPLETGRVSPASSEHTPTNTLLPLENKYHEASVDQIVTGSAVPHSTEDTLTVPSDTAAPLPAFSLAVTSATFEGHDMPKLVADVSPDSDVSQPSGPSTTIPEHQAKDFPAMSVVNGGHSRSATLEKTLFLTTGITKGVHRRHSSRELQTGWQKGHKHVHRRHSSREIAVEQASFASGFSMSEVRRINIVRTTSDIVTQRKRSMTTAALGDAGPVAGPDHWTVERWKAIKAASENKNGAQPNKSHLSTMSEWLPSPSSSPGIEESGVDYGKPGQEISPSLLPQYSRESQPPDADADLPSVPELSPDLNDTSPGIDEPFPITVLSTDPDDRDFVTPVKSALAEPAYASTDDQIDRRIDHILHTLPTRINFNKRNGAHTPSRLSGSSTGPNQSSPSSILARQDERSPTPSLTLSRVEQPVIPTTKAKSNISSIRLYHLIQAGRSAPIKLFVRLVGDEGRVMVRVGGGWEDLEKYLREYSAHHSRAIVPDLKDLDAGASTERRAFTVPTIVANRVSSNPSSAEKPFAGRGISRLSKAPASKDLRGLQVPKRSADATMVRSVSEALPLPSAAPAAVPVTPLKASFNDLEDHSDDSPSPSPAHITAEKREWLNSIVAKAKRWKAEGGSAGPISNADRGSPAGSLGTRRVYRDSEGSLWGLD